jgi:hypothetical protein
VTQPIAQTTTLQTTPAEFGSLSPEDVVLAEIRALNAAIDATLRTASASALAKSMDLGDSLRTFRGLVRSGWQKRVLASCPMSLSKIKDCMQLSSHRAEIEAAIERGDAEASIRGALRFLRGSKNPEPKREPKRASKSESKLQKDLEQGQARISELEEELESARARVAEPTPATSLREAWDAATPEERAEAFAGIDIAEFFKIAANHWLGHVFSHEVDHPSEHGFQKCRRCTASISAGAGVMRQPGWLWFGIG